VGSLRAKAGAHHAGDADPIQNRLASGTLSKSRISLMDVPRGRLSLDALIGCSLTTGPPSTGR